MNAWLAIMVASALAATAAGGLANVVLATLDREPPADGPSWERERRAALRARHAIYRLAEPVVDDLASWFARRRPADVAWLDRRLVAAGRGGQLRGGELAAVATIEGLLAGLAVGLVAWAWPVGLLTWPLALGAAVLGAAWRLYGVLAAAEARARSVRLRLPAALELIGLLLDAGLGLGDSLAAYVREAGDHPLAAELRRLLHDIRSGIPRRDAFQDLAARLDVDVVDELVEALVEGDAGGTPLAQGLRSQAALLRLRQSQWVEEASGRANTYIKGPVLLMVLACLALVIAPFALSLHVHGGLAGL